MLNNNIYIYIYIYILPSENSKYNITAPVKALIRPLDVCKSKETVR